MGTPQWSTSTSKTFLFPESPNITHKTCVKVLKCCVKSFIAIAMNYDINVTICINNMKNYTIEFVIPFTFLSTCNKTNYVTVNKK